MHHICLTHDADVLAGLHHPQPRTVLCIDPLINPRLFITDSIINYLTHSSESCRRFHSNLQTSFADSSSADGRETAALCLAIWPTTLTGEPREKGAIAFRGFKTYIYIYLCGFSGGWVGEMSSQKLKHRPAQPPVQAAVV